MAELTKYVTTGDYSIISAGITDVVAAKAASIWLDSLYCQRPADYRFLAGMMIGADPADPVDRDVIADWLEENGGNRDWASHLIAEETGVTVPVPPEIKVGTYIVPEKWGVIGSCLKAGEPGFCDFYLPTNSGGPIKEVAVNVKITGRQPRWWMSDHWWRIRITFVHDGEPNTTTGGWVKWRQE